MTDTTIPVASEVLPRAARLAALASVVGLLVGSLAVGLGLTQGAIAHWAFGVACLLQIPTTLVVRSRILDGLGNRGLDRELRTLRIISHLLRLLAIVVMFASVYALYEHQVPEGALPAQGLAALYMSLLALLWCAKQTLAELHPSLALDATRARAALELAGLLLVGSVLGHWFPWADALTGMGLALRIFSEGHTLAKLTTLKVACGGCGGVGGCK